MFERVGFIGLGRMGQRMATRLLDAGLQLTVYDVDGEKSGILGRRGAQIAALPRAVASEADAIISSVTDGPAVLDAMMGPDGLLAGASSELLFIEMSTIGVDDSRQVAAACEAAAVRYVRSPVLGTIDAAAGGTLNALISGPRAAVDDALPLLAHLTAQHTYLGPAEEGRVVKLLMNSMLAVSMASFAEALVAGENAGLDVDLLLDVMTGSATASRATRGAAEMVRAREFEPRLSAALMLKDLRLFQEMAADTHTPVPVTGATRQLYEAVVSMGWADLDRAAIVLLLERLAGIDRSP
jgi:3-hydroxyisobutyrate dehydrogenase-like beta-hydroxyacid dehydrogenase